MKKVLSLVLALTMILSCFTVAFAAPEDVTDENQVKAVDALMSLGIVNGYTDGSYKPGNTVTRAEMAKLLVTALGHGDLAQGSESSFKDAKGKWYDGFVAMAAGLELVTGYPDGTFKGDNPVSYQEAIVMTLRALGYTNSAVNNGVNSYNASKYKALGATVGLLDNVTYKNSGANRGDVAVIVYNALETETVDVNEKGLAEKIVVDKTLVQVPGSNPAVYKEKPVYEVLLDRVADREDVPVTVNSLNPKHKDYLGNIVELDSYMYQTITAYLNDDGHVMFVKGSKTPTVEGTVSGIRTTDIQWNDVANQTKVFVTKEDKSVEKVQFNTTAGATVPAYLNGGETTATLAQLQRGGSLNGADVTLILNSNDVITHVVAKQSDASVQMSKAYKAGSTTLGSIKLPKDSSNKVDLSKVTVKGEVTAIEDIVEKDVVTVFYAAGNNTNPSKVELVVCRDTVEGKITGTSSAGAYYVINGDSYYSYATVAVGDEGVFYLDFYGDIVAFEGKSISNADYAFITSIKGGVVAGTPATLLKDASIKLLDKEGKSTTFNFTSTAQYVLTNAAGVRGTATAIFPVATRPLQTLDATFAGFRTNQYIVTGYELNADGQISLIAIQQLTTKSVNPESKTFVAADDVVVFSVYDSTGGSTADTFKVAKVEDLAKLTKTYYAVTNNKGEFELIIADEQLVDNSSYAIITGVESAINNNNQVVSKVTAYVKGEKVEYLTAAGVSVPAAADYRTKLFTLPLSNGVISSDILAGAAIVPTASTTESAISAVNVNRETFSLNGSPKALADNAAVYVYTQSTTTGVYGFSRVGDISDLELENATFQFYNLNPATDTNGDVFEVVIIQIAR